jgi:hypothetical protein
MIKFKQKEYGVVQKAKEVAPLASLGVSTAALGVAGVNATTNVKRSRTDKKYQKDQLKAMKDLTKSLNDFDQEIKGKKIIINASPAPENKPKKFFKFFQKNNSKTADFAIKGAKLGAGIGLIGTGLLPRKLGVNEEKKDVWETDVKKTDSAGYAIREGEKHGKYDGDFVRTDRLKKDQIVETPVPGWDKGWRKKISNIYNNSSDSVALRKAIAGVSSIAIGATLGALVGVIYDIADVFDKKNVDKRLTKKIVEALKKIGFKEEQDFTVNPKTATLMKTKVCLGISRSADTLKLLVNTVNDPKLSKLAQDTTKNLPSMSTRAERVTDRFNDINITTASGQGDSTFVASIAEKFIRAGYPVQLVEVG